jgi:hypothetical protein
MRLLVLATANAAFCVVPNANVEYRVISPKRKRFEGWCWGTPGIGPELGETRGCMKAPKSWGKETETKIEREGD